MRIAVDVMGGDHGCKVAIEGIKLALHSSAGISELYIVGRQEEINPALMAAGCEDPRIRIVHAPEVLAMDDRPVEGLRKKRNCSILRAVELLKEGRVDALISSGNTGGLVAASTIRLRPVAGVDRPAIATVIPTRKNPFVLLDSGATVECRPVHLLHFAIMGSAYAREVLGCSRPRVSILSNGTEANKGNELTIGAARLCREVDLNFTGYIEGNDLFNDKADVVVCDGFVGNIVLKTIESFAKGIAHWLEAELSKGPEPAMGASLAKDALQSIKRRMDPENCGGAHLLGVNGIVMKAHGSSRERAIMNAVRLSTEAVHHQLNQVILNEIAQANERVANSKAAALAST